MVNQDLKVIFTIQDTSDYKKTKAHINISKFYNDIICKYNIWLNSFALCFNRFVEHTEIFNIFDYVVLDPDLLILKSFIYDKLKSLDDSIEKIIMCQIFIHVSSSPNTKTEVQQLLGFLTILKYILTNNIDMEKKQEFSYFLVSLLKITILKNLISVHYPYLNLLSNYMIEYLLSK